MVVQVALQLLGKPAMTVAGSPVSVGPRKNLQMLALLALEPSQRLHREKIAEYLWPDEPEPRRREHLRPVISRLKGALAELGLSDLLIADGPYLTLSRAIPTSLDAILDGESAFSEDWLVEVMAGWDEGVVIDIRLRVERALLENLEGHRKCEGVQGNWIDRMFKFVQIYPLCVRGVALLYLQLKQEGQLDLAATVLERFESAWLDKYGTVGLPDIDAEAAKLDRIATPRKTQDASGTQSTRTNFFPLLSIGFALLISAFALNSILKRKPFVRAHPWQLHGWARTTDSGKYSAYVFCPDGVTWDDANSFAKALGCQLSSIHSREQNLQVFAGAGEQFALEDELPGWIGAKRSTGYWKWSDGSHFDYSNWDSGTQRTAECAGFHIVGPATSAPWAGFPCSALADGFFLESGLGHPNQAYTEKFVADWKYEGGAN